MRPVFRLAVRFVAPALTFATLVHCSSKQGDSVVGGGVTGAAQNETDGGNVPYPTTNIGIGQRGVDANGNPGTKPGNVIANYRFLGYPNADASKGLQTISLSDYYDPTASKYKVLHIIAAAEWCNPCNLETSALLTDLATPATDFEAQGVVYLQTLIEGNTPNTGATQADLNDWIAREKPTFTEVLDPEAAQLGAFFKASAVPFNADIDVRSMEVLQAGVGQEDPATVKTWLAWVAANPPAYKQ
jgi:hypothetical protein